ncbi:MAG TPA: TIGR03943 family protein, partial [Mycobacterium sp.]|nr:TIGR03943 family protein [Mycobacterium sp.]
MSRETENALLLLLGLATAIITITGVYTRYVKP